MISLDQVFLLEQKVESAVAKIQQLQAENDALRSKCNELTNALSAKSEQLTSFESDQSQIESGIKKALDRLNAIENSVLKTAATVSKIDQVASPTPQPVQPVQTQPVQPVQTQPIQTPVQEPEINNEVQEESPSFGFDEAPSFETMVPTEEFTDNSFEENIPEEPEEEDSQDGLGFDIF